MADFYHNPVMVAEVITALQPRTDGIYFDGTVGGGGHMAAILAASAPTGRVYGCDRDAAAIEYVRDRLASYGARIELRHSTFDRVSEWLATESCDGALLDLGVSSAQLDQTERGFSFNSDGPLDMRMDRNQTMTAAQFLAESDSQELARVFWELGGERESRRLAFMIDQERRLHPIKTTLHLANIIAKGKKSHERRLHPATRIFQALRMTVNDELGALARGLPAVWSRLKIGGRLVIITFHSGEDRAVKEFSRNFGRAYTLPPGTMVDIPELRQPKLAELKIVTRKAIQPSTTEVETNPRARSAQLRVFEKIH